ncbi:MAG TPA: hypothetical protein EYH03_03550 [Chromatiales bacterium]|nr:hypothetical protein [Chromatiales bacterium]
MKALFDYFLNLCLLRKGPQDVPFSRELLLLVWVVNLTVGWLLIGDATVHPFRALLESLSDSLLMLGVLWLLLQWRGKTPRFVQSATAALGSGALLGIIALPLVRLVASGTTRSAQTDWAGMLLLAVVVWSVVVFGHILRYALDVKLGEGVALSFIYTVLSYSLLNALFLGG